jgi:NAD(P) transhydrogenase subunit alpha
MDLVITTALIPNKPAPILVTAEMIRTMKAGSVIVDMAAEAGGNCEITIKGDIVEDASGVTIVGKTNYPAEMPGQASFFLSQNFLALLELVGGGTNWNVDITDQVVQQMTVMYRGTPVERPPPMAVSAAGPRMSVQANQARLNEAQQRSAAESNGVILQWLQDNGEEAAVGFGLVTAACLGLTLPAHEVQQLGNFILASLIGHFTVSSVAPSLHTPLIAVTNAISGIIVIGGLLQLGGPVASGKVICALLAVFFASVNIAGGFAVAQRMIQMFKSDKELH